jgi:mannose-6-phosphate isomerase class I
MAEVIDPDGSNIPLGQLLSERKYPLSIQAKVLDIGRPLSIQLHPDRANARRLHAAEPHNYPDEIPKYEGAVAISNTRLLLGWRPSSEIHRIFAAIAQPGQPQDLQVLCEIASSGSDDADFYRRLVDSILDLQPSSIQTIYQRLVRARAGDLDILVPGIDHLLDLVPALRDYDKDCGVVFACVLNIVTRAPGDPVFIPVGVPHAYLSGCVAEIMLPSDNVIRLGLTPKHIDVIEAKRCLDYEYRPISNYLPGTTSSGPWGTFYEIGEGLAIAYYDRSQSTIRTLNESQILVFLGDAEGDIQYDKSLKSIKSYSALLLPPSSKFELRLTKGKAIRFLRTS